MQTEIKMRYPGGLVENLKRAVISARGTGEKGFSPVVLERWQEMVDDALKEIGNGHRASATLVRLVFELQAAVQAKGFKLKTK